MVAEAASGLEAIQGFREHKPDVTLMDLRLPDMSGIDEMIAILCEFPEARIVMLTTFEGDAEIQRALGGGCTWLFAKEHAAIGSVGCDPPGSRRKKANPCGSSLPARGTYG